MKAIHRRIASATFDAANVMLVLRMVVADGCAAKALGVNVAIRRHNALLVVNRAMALHLA